jgi:hypothetical protein
MPGGVTMSWGAAGEYNVYNELQYNYGTATVKVNVSNVQGNVYIFRKAFDSGGNFIASYFVTQPLINGVNTFIVSSVYGAGVAIEQLGIFVRSNQFVTDPHSTCNILGVNITVTTPPPPTPVFGKPTIKFPLLFGAPSTSYSQSSPGPYNTILNDQYYLDMPGGVTMSWGAAGEYNVYNELLYNYGTATVEVNVSNVQGNVYIFRKAFDSGGNFIGSYFVTQPLINGVNTFIVSSVYGPGVSIEQLGIFVLSNPLVTDPHSTCNILGVNITYS